MTVDGPLWDTATVAAELGVSVQRVRALASSGRIPSAQRVADRWVFSPPIVVLSRRYGPRGRWSAPKGEA